MANFFLTMGSFNTTFMGTGTQPAALSLQVIVFRSCSRRRPSTICTGVNSYLTVEQLSRMFFCFPGGSTFYPMLSAEEFLLGELRNVLPRIPEEELLSRGELLVSNLMEAIPYVLLDGENAHVVCHYHAICIPPSLVIPPSLANMMLEEEGVLVLGSSDSSAAQLLALNGCINFFIFGDNTNVDLHEEASSCAICLEDYVQGDWLARLSCSHVYHWKCLLTWVMTMRKNTCPLCRRDVIPARP